MGKRKPGRPATGQDRSKLYHARAFRVTDAESLAFDRQAEAQGLSSAEALRKLVRGFIDGSFAIQLWLL